VGVVAKHSFVVLEEFAGLLNAATKIQNLIGLYTTSFKHFYVILKTHTASVASHHNYWFLLDSLKFVQTRIDYAEVVVDSHKLLVEPSQSQTAHQTTIFAELPILYKLFRAF